jgi:hypothetical protein
MKQKIIGIPAYSGKEIFGCGLGYLDWISQFGIPRLIFPKEEFVKGLDMLFLPGGPDLNPTSYNAIPEFYTNSPCIHRQFFYDIRLKNYIGKVPIFGTCLGFQMLNCFFSGKLEQDISHYVDKDGCHEIYDMEYKLIKALPKDKEGIKVTSSHHQGFKINNLGENLTPLAQSAEGYIERMENTHLNIAGVQSHPERLEDEWSVNKINEFLKIK